MVDQIDMKITPKLVRFAASQVEIPPEIRFRLPPEVRDAQPEIPLGTNLLIWRWDRSPTGPYLYIAFQGRGKKPIEYYVFQNATRRDEAIDRLIRVNRSSMSQKLEEQEAKKVWRHPLKKDDILYSSWGYDQTNVEFYQVVEAGEFSVKLRQIAEKIISSNPPTDYVMPVPNRFISAPFTKRPQKFGEGTYIKIDRSSTASPWDGQKKYQTTPGWGH